MWAKLRALVKDSETIAYSYLMAGLGVVGLIVTYVDPTLVTAALPAKYAAWFLLINAVFVKWLRERRDPDLGKQDHADDADIRGV